MSKPSILADTLKSVQQVREAIEKNANHVLKSTLKEELESIIHKGLEEMEDEEENNFGDINPDSKDGMDTEPAIGSETGDATTEPGIGDTPTDEIPGDEVVDLTDKSDEEVLKRFELMEPTDEIEIVRTGEGITINFHPEPTADDSEGSEEGGGGLDFNPAAIGGGEESEEESEEETEPQPGMDESEEEEGAMYEIEISETDDTEEEGTVAETEEEEEGTMDEVKTTSHIKALQHKVKPGGPSEDIQEKLVNTRKKLQTLVVENKKIKTELEAFKSLKESFVSNEKEYKSAIKVLKNQLQEVSLFTTNLTYAVKLMTENTTTKDEKYQILSTLDKAKTLNESQNIAATLEEQFKTKKSSSAASILESKVLDKPGMSSSSDSINESTVYRTPQIDRMRELIGKIK